MAVQDTQVTVNNQIVVSTLMNMCDDPTRVSIGEVWREEAMNIRVPVFVTGNDFSTLYAPLIRDGRMDKCAPPLAAVLALMNRRKRLAAPRGPPSRTQTGVFVSVWPSVCSAASHCPARPLCMPAVVGACGHSGAARDCVLLSTHSSG